MSRLTFTCLLVLFAAISTKAQFSCGLKVGGGVSYLGNKSAVEAASQKGYFYKSKAGFSSQTGIFCTQALGDRGVLGFELLASFLGHGELSNEGLDAYYTEREIRRNMVYLAAPIWVGTSFGNWTFHIGAQTSYFIAGTLRSRENLFDRKGNWTSADLGGFRHIDIGPRAGFIYQLAGGISLEASYYHGIPNVPDGLAPEGRIRNHQALLGIRFSFCDIKPS